MSWEDNQPISRGQKKLKDYTGQRFGRYVVLKRLPRAPNQRNFKMLCRCDCGTIRAVWLTSLNGGGSRSCGCLGREKSRKRLQLPKGEASRRARYRVYEQGANKRKLCWELTYEDFCKLTEQDCYYCGLPPSSEFWPSRKKTNGAFIYTGIDRIDSEQGYSINNVRPCCRDCNFAKFTKTEEEFIEWLMRITTHWARYQMTLSNKL